jgi:hypothetical protein
MGHINFDSILAKALRSRRVQQQAYAAVSERVTEVKADLLHDFNSHPVTKEIEAGPELESSDVLPGGYGNVWSFMGFVDGRDPTGPVREKLETISVNQRPEIRRDSLNFKVSVPTDNELEDVSWMDWEAGKSWLSAVERGLSGFSSYLFTLSRNVGRSGAGIQTNTDMSKGSARSGGKNFVGTPYLFTMMKKFRSRLNRNQV